MYFFTLVVRYFADAQYDVRSPIVGFADTLPEGESEISFTVFAKERGDCGKLPGGWRSTKYMSHTFSVGLPRLRLAMTCLFYASF